MLLDSAPSSSGAFLVFDNYVEIDRVIETAEEPWILENYLPSYL